MRWARYLPHPISRRLGAIMGRVAHRLDPAARRRSHESLSLAFPDLEAGRIAQLASQAAAHRLATRFDAAAACRFDARAFCRRLTLQGWEHLEEAERQGRGIFILGAPLGAWQIAMLAIALYRGPVQPVGSWFKDPALGRLAASFASSDSRLFEASADKHPPQNGERFALLAGHLDGPGPTADVSFLGRTIRATPWVASASIESGAPIVPVFGRIRSKGGWVVTVHEPIQPSLKDADSLTARYLETVSDQVRRRPERWLDWQAPSR